MRERVEKVDVLGWNKYDTKHRDKIYSWFCEPMDGSREILEGNNIVYYYETCWERGIIQYNKM